MGMQSSKSAAPLAVRLAASVLVVEAAGLLLVAVLTAIDVAKGRSYQLGSGIALTLIAFCSVAALIGLAVAVFRVRPWSRTPTAMVHLCVVVVAVYLMQGHRYSWGVPCMAIAVTGLGFLLTPGSIRALQHTLPSSEPVSGSAPGQRRGKAAAGKH